jgi:MFS family permease
MQSSRYEPRTASPSARNTLRLVAAATVLALSAFTMPLGLMGSIGPDLSASSTGRTWILSAMSIGLAGALLVAGSAADDLGRRRVFLLGLLTFVAGTVLAAAAPSVLVLSVARAVEGVGAAALLASSLALLAHEFPAGPARAHATGVWGAMLGGGIAVGPLAGALVAELASWRTSYAVLGVVGVALAAPTRTALVESRAAVRRPIDRAGAALLAAGMVVLTAGVVQGNGSGWTSAPVLGALLGGVGLLAVFAAVEQRTAAPLFDLRLLRRPMFTAAIVGSLALGMTALGFMSYSMTFVETALGSSAVEAALWTLPWAVVSFVIARRAGFTARYLSDRAQTTAGLVLCAAGLVAMLGLDADSSPAHLVPGFVILGVGTGVLNAALAHAAVSVVPADRSGMGAGANNTARYVGAALGVALVVALLHSGTEHRAADALRVTTPPAQAEALSRQIADGGITAVDRDLRQPVARVAAEAATGAMDTVLLAGAGLALTGALVCFLLMARPSPVAVVAARKVPM